MKFVIARHAQTDWNALGRIQGHTDRPLNETGLAQARQLGERLLADKVKVTKIISSDLSRARRTAEVVNEFFQAPLAVDERLREAHFGSLEGLTREAVFAQQGDWIVPYFEPDCYDYDFRNLGGEHSDGVFARHQAVFDEACQANLEGMVLLVGHGRGWRTVLGRLGYEPQSPEQGTYKIIEYASKL